jgi:16S rRNA (uracil1498-N3)-methyltransferase
MHRFISLFPLALGKDIPLDADQSHHLAKVLRLSEGDRILLLDGKGGVAKAVLNVVKGRECIARVEEASFSSRRSQVRLCFAIPKGQALDFIFRRATELGIHSLQPLQTQHSSSKKNWNADRWRSVVEEVSKQCEEAYFPETPEPIDLGEWLAAREPQRNLAFCNENAREDKAVFPPGVGVDLLVGAEGGFSAEEVVRIQRAGAHALGLGKNRLRAETAALVALTLVKAQLSEI